MASVSYKIKGKYDNKAVKEAQQGLIKLGKTVNNVKKIAGAFMAVFAIKKIVSFANQSIKEFNEINNSLTKLQQAIRNNNNLTQESFKNITSWAAKMQKTLGIDDDILDNQAAYLAGLGLTEKQIKQVLTAAANMTRAGIGTMDSNVKNLAKTFGGLTGRLGETIPELKNLTKEQLKNGEAVELLLEKYKGYGKAFSNTFQGQMYYAKNLMSDIRQSIGGALTSLGQNLLVKIIPILEKLKSWFDTNSSKMINIIINIGNITKLIINHLWNLLKAIFNNIIVNIVYIGKTFFAWIKQIGNVLSAAGNSIWKPLKYGFEVVIYGIKKLFVGIINFFIDKINKLSEPINKLWNKLFKKDFMTKLNKIEINIKQPVEINNTLNEDIKKANEIYNKDVKKTNDYLSESLISIKELNKNFKDTLSKIVNKPVKTLSENDIQTTTAKGPQTYYMGATKDVGQIEKQKTIWEKLLEFINPLINSFGQMFLSLSSVQKILNPLQTILDGIFQVIAPVIDSLLTPLINILTIIGNIIGQILIPVFRILEPVIELVGKAFVWLYNKVLRPFGNFLINIVVGINNTIAFIINGIVVFLNNILGWLGVNIKWRWKTMNAQEMKLKEINYSNLTKTNATENSSGTAGSTASYTGAKDITVNIYFEHSFVNGDAREIALALRNEIRLAESLGL